MFNAEASLAVGQIRLKVGRTMYMVQFNTPAQRKRAFRQMRLSFNDALKAIEEADPVYGKHNLDLELLGYAAGSATAGGPPDPEFAVAAVRNRISKLFRHCLTSRWSARLDAL